VQIDRRGGVVATRRRKRQWFRRGGRGNSAAFFFALFYCLRCIVRLFRGPRAPKGVFVVEFVLESAALACSMPGEAAIARLALRT
jgi:hypothetical protein